METSDILNKFKDAGYTVSTEVEDVYGKFKEDEIVDRTLWEDTCKFCTEGKNRTLVDGFLDKDDICLRKVYVNAGHERLRKAHRYVEYPTDYSTNKKTTGRKVHAVLVYDHRDDGKDRGGKIIEGGIGQDHIKIELESKPGRGMEFTVIIIGK
ncbi:hypothetical protein CHUAL_008889 [Chamberlinius hualienensis]